MNDAPYARFDETSATLTVGNALFERTWRIDEYGFLHPLTFLDRRTDRDWLRHEQANVSAIAPTPTVAVPEERRRAHFKAEQAPHSDVSEPSLDLLLNAVGERATLCYWLRLYPRAAGAAMRLSIGYRNQTAADAADEGEDPSDAPAMRPAPTGIEITDAAGATTEIARHQTDAVEWDVQEEFFLAPLHLRLIAVTFFDQTDVHSELVQEQEWLLLNPEAPVRLSGNLFIFEDTLTGDGLILLKEAPLPHARPIAPQHDLIVRAAERHVRLLGHGMDTSNGAQGYNWVTMSYTGGKAGRTAALHEYQRAVRRYEPSRDGLFLSNTWGDRNRDGRISASFLSDEIEAAARLGVDVVQIDDGWQKGKTSNSVVAGGVWEEFHAAEEAFWEPHPERFPDGLAPLIAKARENGLRFGLWFAPDSSDDFAHWREDADRLLDLHRTHGVDYFKIDGVKLRTKRGERNLHVFFERVQTESAGRIVFDSDVTAETRPGYWGLMQTGPLFVENRYTDFRRYWPHATLRALWKLAHYIDPVRLRMEWLNHARNAEKYGDDPLAPAAYRPDYLFATVMFSSPLGWFEVSNLPETYFAETAPLIALWKAHREAIFSGTILPIGDAPDGTGWTGFVSVDADRRGAYLLIFRELNADLERAFSLPIIYTDREPHKVEKLAG